MVNIGIPSWVALILRLVYVWPSLVLSTWYIIGFSLFPEITFLNSILLNIYSMNVYHKHKIHVILVYSINQLLGKKKILFP